MKSSVGWLLKRQYLPSLADVSQLSVIDRSVERFTCFKYDEYSIHGEMGMPLPPFAARFSPVHKYFPVLKFFKIPLSQHREFDLRVCTGIAFKYEDYMTLVLLGGDLLGVADEDGHVKLVDTRRHNSSSLVKEWSAHSNAVFDVAWVEDQPKLVTASGDQTARLWDVEKAETIGIFRGHTCSLKSVAVQPQTPSVFISGARDGNIMIWDTRCFMRNGFHNPVNTIRGAHVLPFKDGVSWSVKKRRTRRTSLLTPDSKQSVTTVVFQDKNTVVSAGACDGVLKMWDIRKNYTNFTTEPQPYHLIPYPEPGPRKHGYSTVVLDSTKSRLFAVCTNDTVYEYCCSTVPQRPVATYQGHSASSFYVKATISPDDKYLLCGSSDSSAYIWRIDHPDEPPWLLTGHLGEVTSVAWSPNSHGKIVTCSDDNTFKIWRIPLTGQSADGVAGKCERSKPLNGAVQASSADASIGRANSLESNQSLTSCVPGRTGLQPLDLRPRLRLKLPAPSINSPRKPRGCHFAKGSGGSPVVSTKARRKSVASTSSLASQMLISLPKVGVQASCTHVSPSHRSTTEPTTPRSSRTFMEMWLSTPSTRSKHRRVPPDSPSKKIKPSLLPRDKEAPSSKHSTSNFNSGALTVHARNLEVLSPKPSELLLPVRIVPNSHTACSAFQNSCTLDLSQEVIIKKRPRDLSSIKSFVHVSKRKRNSNDSEYPAAKHVRADSEHCTRVVANSQHYNTRSNKENDSGAAASADSDKVMLDQDKNVSRDVSPVKTALSEKIAVKKGMDLLEYAEESSKAI